MRTPNQFSYFDDQTLMALETAMHSVWSTLQSHDPFRDWDSDGELKARIAKKLTTLAEHGVKDPEELRSKVLQAI